MYEESISMNEDKISIIIPIYKVEKYLSKCVDSVLNQTYNNLEIILVDDGSPDMCGAIADSYREKDERVCVIHKENGGLSDARNAGIDVATGKYIVFVDSDDMISETFVEKMHRYIVESHAQISVCKRHVFYEDGKIGKAENNTVEIKVKDSVEAAKIILYQDGYDVSAWGKMYLKETFDGVYFPKGYNFEDIPTTYKAFMRAERVVFSNETLYEYLIRENSIETEPFTLKKLDGIYTGQLMLDDIIKEYPELLSAAKSRYIAINLHILSQINGKNEYVNKIKDNVIEMRHDVMKDKSAIAKVRIACLLSYISFNGLLKIMKWMK